VAQSVRGGGPRGTRADPGESDLAARGRFRDEQCKAKKDQHASEHAARRTVEGGLELLEDRDGERVEADHRECAEFRE
jgi:hypothetical protein